MTPTPRTDKAIQRCACADYIIEPAFARQLERELAAANERLEKAQAKIRLLLRQQREAWKPNAANSKDT